MDIIELKKEIEKLNKFEANILTDKNGIVHEYCRIPVVKYSDLIYIVNNIKEVNYEEDISV